MGLIQNNQGYASASSNATNTNSSINASTELTDEEIIVEAIQNTGASSIADIVKIIEYFKEKTGKDIDQSLAITLLQKKLKNI